jgi:hypothetical protein
MEPARGMNEVYNHQTARIGYTDHAPGMYSDRFTHKNIQTENGRYIWLGDKYEDPGRALPPRWKDKQFKVANEEWYPGARVEGNVFGLNGKRVQALRDGDLYASVHAAIDKVGSNKVGFGCTVGKTKVRSHTLPNKTYLLPVARTLQMPAFKTIYLSDFLFFHISFGIDSSIC